MPPSCSELQSTFTGPVGKGVFAKVRLTHRGDGQMVAVKTYDHKEAREERAVAKHMHNEERLAGKLQHENIIAPQVARKGQVKTANRPRSSLEPSWHTLADASLRNIHRA